MTIRSLSSLAEIVPAYDAFILDLWGVIHDGQATYPGVKEALTELRKQGKKIVLLSNAPRRAVKVIEAMEKMGLPRELYDHILTSGEAAFQSLKQEHEGSVSYRYIGLEKDRMLLDGLNCHEVDKAAGATFLLCAHSYYDNQPMEELEPILKDCLAHRLPMLCVNPDKEVVRMSGERVYCAGKLAEDYAKRGGLVRYYGKPHPLVYTMCFEWLADIDKKRIVAVGDSLTHDIKGGAEQGLDTVIVTGGLLKERVKTELLEAICQQAGVLPTYALPAFQF